MVNKSLVKYIKEQIKSGHDTESIRGVLLKNGYPAVEVDEAIRYVYSPEVRHVIHFSPTTMISIVAVFIGIVVVSLVLFNLISSNVPSMLLDLNLEGIKTTAKVGEDINFIAEIDNLGSAKRYDVNLRYEVINLETNNVLTFKEETRAIETKGSKSVRLGIPSDAAIGDYILRAIATYNSQKAVATLPIKILEEDTEEITELEEPVVVEEPEEVSEESKEDPVEEPPEDQEEEKETAGNDALTTYEALEKVESIAKQNRREAENICTELQLQISKDLCFNKMGEVLGDRTYCGRINDERTEDVCLSNVAKITDNNVICEDISKDSRKDSCYMNFVLPPKHDYSVCGKVTNQYLRQSCDSLRQLNELNITNVVFYESLINQSLFELV